MNMGRRSLQEWAREVLKHRGPVYTLLEGHLYKAGCSDNHWKKGKDPHLQDKSQHLDFTKDPPPAALLQDPSLCILPQKCP